MTFDCKNCNFLYLFTIKIYRSYANVEIHDYYASQVHGNYLSRLAQQINELMNLKFSLTLILIFYFLVI